MRAGWHVHDGAGMECECYEGGGGGGGGGDGRDLCQATAAGRQRQRILMVSDFFYPNFGGVENHIYFLSQCLIRRGHKVVVATHTYGGGRTGVRYVSGGLKVYYLPRLAFYLQSVFPTFYGTFPLLRVIMLRERITLLHAHQAFSCLGLEALLQARTMGYKVVFTDHSLFGFADAASVHMNKVLKFVLADVHHVICVSHTSKENTVLRSGLPAQRVSVIPNAIDTSAFKPDPSRRKEGVITIIVISRLVYRKGIDLLVEVIPQVCNLHPNVEFLIGGDGPKRVRLEEMREKWGLERRVEMVGEVPHARVREVLVRGHIFLNSSLTEAFCIAILEAASCGLVTVATRVGGVPEVLPPGMIVLADPVPADIVAALGRAIEMLPTVKPQEMHEQVRGMYSWQDVAERTERVYDMVAHAKDDTLLDRLGRYYNCGPWAGKLFCLVAAVGVLLLKFLEWWQPAKSIEMAPDLNPHSLGGRSRGIRSQDRGTTSLPMVVEEGDPGGEGAKIAEDGD
ncbi:hypothetical protein CBR_g8747 [Chara braunii]|uniref:phosphatidylinositol N-acetylglucosaminyltransferase n=1 Tax=Chara braunii TaxID=69332 RepID=A0A388KMR9_CHABU|nr:hypothetical protein CBR_g8747 [Chara braunii]|eukprot:GBG71325.1 hypothetical protein CBR_g8747 [Chara braunii]